MCERLTQVATEDEPVVGMRSESVERLSVLLEPEMEIAERV